MNPIKLHTDMPRNITMIPNEFLDHYMSRANGEFLKIYLYLLRWAGCTYEDITTCSIADFFNMTENDVKRALRFWEQEDLLRIAWDTDGNITAICLRPVAAPYVKTDTSEASAQNGPKPFSENLSSDSKTSVKAPDTISETPSGYQIPSYTMKDLQGYMENSDVKNLFLMFQELTGKPLNPKDMNSIIFFYDELGMDADLIEYLFEYCISNGHRKMNYIQAVAIGWTESGIKTVEAAKLYCASYNKLNAAVMNAFGIKGRYLADKELSYIRRWHQDYKFSQELITEACRRTILTAHSASFNYANTILERWKNNQVETLDDVARLDTAFEQAKAVRSKQAKEAKNSKASAPKKPASRFHNFNQRTYDYGDMEMAFMKKLHSDTTK